MANVHIFRLVSDKPNALLYPPKAFSSFDKAKDYVKGEFGNPDYSSKYNIMLDKWFTSLCVEGVTRHDPFGPTIIIDDLTLSIESIAVDV